MNPLWVARVSYAIACASGVAWAALDFGLSGAMIMVMIIAVVSFILALHEL